MSYALECEDEFDRLEAQTRHAAFSHEAELRDLEFDADARVLDAGCGSGLVSRFLAEKYPDAQFVGVDQSQVILDQAKGHPENADNIDYVLADLRELPFDSESFDVVVCRYVLEHMPYEHAEQVVSEVARCLRPGGRIVAVDADGYMHNIFPRPQIVDEALEALRAFDQIDLFRGRKLGKLFAHAGLADISTRIDTHAFEGEGLRHEIELLKQRFANAHPMFVHLLGGDEQARRFEEAYLELVEQPGVTYFFNMFTVTGRRLV